MYEERYGRGRGRDSDHERGARIKPNYFLPKPVKVGDVLDVTIEAIAVKGDGIARKDGFVIFVKGARQGQTVNVRITEVRPRFAIGEIAGAAAAAPSAEPSEQSGEGSEESAESEETEESSEGGM